MRTVIASLALALTLGACATTPRVPPEAELAQSLRGRVAEAPETCIDLQRVRSVSIVERTALLYDAGDVVYVNRPAPARNLRELDTLVSRSFAGQLCRGEPVNLVAAGSPGIRGFVILGDFVPYRRAG